MPLCNVPVKQITFSHLMLALRDDPKQLQAVGFTDAQIHMFCGMVKTIDALTARVAALEAK